MEMAKQAAVLLQHTSTVQPTQQRQVALVKGDCKILVLIPCTCMTTSPRPGGVMTASQLAAAICWGAEHDNTRVGQVRLVQAHGPEQASAPPPYMPGGQGEHSRLRTSDDV